MGLWKGQNCNQSGPVSFNCPLSICTRVEMDHINAIYYYSTVLTMIQSKVSHLLSHCVNPHDVTPTSFLSEIDMIDDDIIVVCILEQTF